MPGYTPEKYAQPAFRSRHERLACYDGDLRKSIIMDATQPPPSLSRYAWLSIAAAISTILLKGTAWWLTGSVGLLSDAIESFVNLAGALMALAMLTVAAMPADDKHAHGHSKAEYFSSAFEGFLILLAAFSIAYTAIERLLSPVPLEAVGIGLAVSVIASIINLLTARTLMTVGRKYNSITLEADAHHLMTDVWTSVGVIAGVGLVWLTGWSGLMPQSPSWSRSTSYGPAGNSCSARPAA